MAPRKSASTKTASKETSSPEVDTSEIIDVTPEVVEPVVVPEKPTKKIAILGTAPSSWKKAPFHDESWEVWGLTLLYKEVPRWDRWFELHSVEMLEKTFAAPEYMAYVKWMSEQEKPIFTFKESELLPNTIIYPKDEMVNMFGKFFFTSSIAWMLALAIYELQQHDGPKQLGIWGVDMSQQQEYDHQRKECQHFLTLARHFGIEVHLPPESDLNRSGPMYPWEDPKTPLRLKMEAREEELNERVNRADQTMRQTNDELQFLKGALEDVKYILANWADG